ncbi:MAG: hypothetical protein ACKVU2_18085 [Saprospiraceae bacterium]
MKKILLFTLLALVFVACSKDDDSLSSDADFFFIGKLDGTAVKHELTATNETEMSNSNGGSIGTPDCIFDYGCSIGGFDPGKTYLSVDFSGLFSGDCGTEGAIFPSLFPTGKWPFGESKGQVTVVFFDGTELWSSAKGGQASDADFTVTKSEKLETVFGQSMSIRGTVSCTLYSDSGASKKLEAGSYSLNFVPYF